jgi:hypothetical protein
MDFVGVLPKTVTGFHSIWVVVDRLTKSAYFIPIKTGMFVAKLAEIYIDQVVRLHGMPLIEPNRKCTVYRSNSTKRVSFR